MEQKFNRYKIKVNEDLIDSFFAHPVSEATKEELEEVNKVITIVLKLYYAKYWRWYEDLRSWVLTAIFERHCNYDPQWRSYNYVFRIARNEAGNKILRYDKEQYVDVLPEPDGRSTVDVELLGEIKEILPYVSGQVEFTMIDVPQNCMLPLIKLAALQEPEANRDKFKDRVIETLIFSNYE